MKCVICYEDIINDGFHDQVKNYWIKHGSLDLKHEWVKAWKLCKRCTEKWANEDIQLVEAYLKGQTVSLAKVLQHQIEKTQQLKERKKKEKAKEIYISKVMEQSQNREQGGIRPQKVKNRKKYNEEYISYVENNESAAVLLVRDLVEKLDTRGYWIDVVALNTYERQRRIGFNYIIVELFKRRMQPQYTKGLQEEHFAYITWQTATSDIAKQRSQGIKGQKYLILPYLFNKNLHQYEQHRVTWNAKREHYIRSQDGKETLKVQKPPLWKYDIRAIEKVNERQVKYIKTYEYDILERMFLERKTDVKWFLK